MSLAEFLSLLRERDIRLWTEKGKLRCNAPQGALTQDIRSQLSHWREDILHLLEGMDSSEIPAIVTGRESSDSLPVSFAQHSLWIVDQWEASRASHNFPVAFRLEGELNIAAIEYALKEVVRRHEILRTTFAAEEGTVTQSILPELRIPIAFIDLMETAEETRSSRVRELASRDAQQAFDLTKAPLLRCTLLRINTQEYVLLITLHHIIFDGWSLGVLIRELTDLYAAFVAGNPLPLQPLRLQYADYAIWQRERLQGEVLERQLGYWTRQLAEAPALLELPADRIRPAVQSFRGACHYFHLDASVTSALRTLSRQRDCTLFMTVLAAFKTLIYRYTGREDVIIGTPVANRPRQEMEEMIGFFVNTVVLRTDLSGNPCFTELIERVKAVTLGAFANQDLPFERLVEELQPERTLSHTPLYQIAFIMQNAPMGAIRMPGLAISTVEADVDAQFDLTFELFDIPDSLEGRIVYSSDLFDLDTISRFVGHFKTLLEGIISDPEAAISALPLMNSAEQNKLLQEWNSGSSNFLQGDVIHTRFEAQAKQTPDATAIVYQDREISYSELNRRANQLAHYLRKQGTQQGQLVGMYTDRSVEMVIGILGILKAGGAYLPLDPMFPRERIKYMLTDSEVELILTQEELVHELAGEVSNMLCLDRDWHLMESEPANNLSGSVNQAGLAYVIYTSGSTGNPKGTLVTHSNVVRLFDATQTLYGFGAGDVWVLFHSYSFDVSVWELWGALFHGGRIVIAPYEVTRSPQQFYDLLHEKGVTVLNQVPTAFHALARLVQEHEAARIPSLRWVIFAGEALDIYRLEPWFERYGDEQPQLVNMYGITETTVHATFRRITKQDLQRGAGSVIGCAFPDLQLYILDSRLNPVPVGVPGEIYVGGAGVSLGYFKRPDLTAERFIPNPYSLKGGERLYKSGDLARYLRDGDIEYLGRMDQQVKMRGYRVEMGEIEAALSTHPGVQSAVAMLQELAEGERRLAAYIVPDPQSSSAISGILRLQEEAGSELSLYTLPNGLELVHRNKNETEFMYREIWDNESYSKRGIALEEGSCIFDVGANIGMFALYAGAISKNCTIYAFEPIPPVFRALEQNVRLYGLNARLFACGLADANKTETFSYYPNLSILSGRYADVDEEKAVVRAFLKHQHLEEIGEEMIQDMLNERLATEKHECQLRTISDIIMECDVESIDLLKVDVEKGELDVLKGIKEQDWPKIKQIVLETHDREGRLQEVEHLLIRHGFEVWLEQDSELSETGLYNVYALRPAPAREVQAVQTGQPELTDSWRSRNTLIRELRELSSNKLPWYMVPSDFILLPELPLTPSGKIDRKRMPGLNTEKGSEEYVAPSSEVEKSLAEIWAGVLGVERVSVHDNFFELGGDSILSIQIAERAHRLGIHIHHIDIFRHQTIAGLAPLVQERSGADTEEEQEMITGSCPLSPVQSWFFSMNQPEQHHWNMSFMLEVRERYDYSHWEYAVERLVQQHDALRTRFVQTSEGWEAYYGAEPLDMEAFKHVSLEHIAPEMQAAAIEEQSNQLQKSLNLSTGRVVQFVLFRLGAPQPDRLLMICHHLVIDGFSWRVILEDLQSALWQAGHDQKIQLQRKTTSYKRWVMDLKEKFHEGYWEHDMDYWLADSSRDGVLFPTDKETDSNTAGSSAMMTVTLEREDTSALLREVHLAYNTRIMDILLAAFLEACYRWRGTPSVRVLLEGHGRDAVAEGIDISRTVGWFTSMYPLLMERAETGGLGGTLKSVKEQLRRVQGKGISYLMYSYWKPDTGKDIQLQHASPAEVIFNYLGQLDQIFGEKASFQPAMEYMGAAVSPLSKRPAKLGVNCHVIEGRLQIHFDYSLNLYYEDSIGQLAGLFKEVLLEIIEHCRSAEAGGFTPSDFPRLQISDQDFNKLLGSIT